MRITLKLRSTLTRKTESMPPSGMRACAVSGMPDGISLITIGGVDYLLTANEGDSREWGAENTESYYLNEDDRNFR